jgi:hypothetical protein
VTSSKPRSTDAIFAAARRDKPAPELKVRTLAQMLELSRHESARVRVLPIVAPVLLAAAAVALWLLKSEAPVPESIVAETIPTPSASKPPPAASATVSAQPPSVVVSSPSPSTRKAPKPPPPPSLSQEVESLDRVQAALDADDPGRALALLDVYRRSGGGRMGAEAQLLRIEALSRAGRSEQARQLAAEFVATHPGNPLIDRARAFVGSSPQ